MIGKPFIILVVLILAVLSTHGFQAQAAVAAGSTVLGSLRCQAPDATPMTNPPAKVFYDDPLDTTVSPGYGAPVFVANAGSGLGQAWQLFDMTEESFNIPAAQATFCATLTWGPAGTPVPEAEENVIWVKFLLDGVRVFSTAVRPSFPSKEIAFSVQGGHVLTVQSEEARFDHGWYYLSGAAFSPRKFASGVRYLPNGTYLAFPNALRQSFFRFLAPGEQVPLTFYSSTPAQTAKLHFTITPERTGPATQPNTTVSITSDLVIPLKATDPGLFEGAVVWQAPALMGPASLTIQGQIVNGGSTSAIPTQVSRIVIAPLVNPSQVTAKTFGIHLSGHGYLRAQDEVSSLWGARWARVFIRWPLAEQQPGVLDFTRQDALIDTIRAQGMEILGVLGEGPPAWLQNGNGNYQAAWENYVRQTVTHFATKIHYWDVYNEVDVKYNGWLNGTGVYGPMPDGDPNGDLHLLSAAMDIIHAAGPSNRTVCCSTGTTWSLFYDDRIFSAGLLPKIDHVSFHPYQAYAPEALDGVFNYDGRLNVLNTLIGKYGRPNLLWNTEANWLLGFNLILPTTTEHDQAEYVVRANLDSFARGVPYFLHSPYEHTKHLSWQVDTLAAYSAMTSRFGTSSLPKILDVAGTVVKGVAATTIAGVVGAAWSAEAPATVRLVGAASASFFDLYGNPLALDAAAIPLSASPVYFSLPPGSTPTLKIVTPPQPPVWTPLPAVSTWTRRPACPTGTPCTTYTTINGGIHVRSVPQTYTSLLVAPSIGTPPMQPGACYVIQAPVKLIAGSIGLLAASTTSSSLLGVTYAAYPPDGVIRPMEMRFFEASGGARVRLEGANRTLDISEFEVYDPVQWAPCP